MRRRAFTLVELLVVIAIIAILASIIIPVMARARQRAAVAVCLNNFKQLQLSFHLYTEDHGGLFPENVGAPSSFPDQRLASVWAGLGMRYEVDNWTIFEPADATNSQALRDPRLSTLSPYYRVPEILKCPADKSFIVIDGIRYPRVRSYSMNCFIAPSVTVLWWGRHMFPSTASTSITIPGNTWIFTDEHEDSIDDCSFMMMPESTPDWFDLPTARHGRSSPFSFLDGHCETHRWVEEGTMKPVQRKRTGRTATTPTNRDVLWIRNSASPLITQ